MIVEKAGCTRPLTAARDPRGLHRQNTNSELIDTLLGIVSIICIETELRSF